MTTTTTEREIRSPQEGGSEDLDSPAVRAQARARLPVTDGEIKRPSRVASAAAQWWAWTDQPPSLLDAWRLSDVNPKRIPADNAVLRLLWHVSNWTDRLIMFLLIFTLPTGCTGVLRWLAQRPTRRVGLYLTLAALTGLYLHGRK